MFFMTVIYESDNFTIRAAELPHVYVSREEGGHIQIKPKVGVSDRTMLSPELAIEYMKLSMVVGEAMKTALGRRGIDIGLINYQDMGNWMAFKPGGPMMHMQIFGRAKNAIKQKYGDAVNLPHLETGFYRGFEPLNEGDIQELRTEINSIMNTPKYRSF
jgi:diadenosine tetraphosphate (Ap4A) HIT family hydrolase